jgi:hypothetical protein
LELAQKTSTAISADAQPKREGTNL